MKQSKKWVLGAALPLVVSMTGCGGGGGGGGVKPSFTSWSAVQPSSTVELNAISREIDEGGLRTLSTNSSLTFTNDADYDWTALRIQTPTSTVSFSASNGDTLESALGGPLGVAYNSALTKVALAADPEYFGWDYQSFGIWADASNPSTPSIGVLSAGAATSGAAIPTSGTATYTGMAGGIYVDSSDNTYLTYADLTIGANFGTRQLTFNTSGTSDLDTDASMSGLNISGTLSYSSGTNAFSGTVTSANSMTGTADGRFYGPSAQEIGGVFFVDGAAGDYGGSFGGKRGAINP